MKGNTVAFFLKFSGQLQRAKAREHIQLYLFTLFNTRNYNTKNKVNKYKEQLQIQNDREMVTITEVQTYMYMQYGKGSARLSIKSMTLTLKRSLYKKKREKTTKQNPKRHNDKQKVGPLMKLKKKKNLAFLRTMSLSDANPIYCT